MATITFLPMDVSAQGAEGESIFDVAVRVGVTVETACVGKGTCGLCRVRIVEGAESLSPYNDVEEKHLGNVYHITRVRLSCQARPRGDAKVVVELAPKRRKRG